MKEQKSQAHTFSRLLSHDRGHLTWSVLCLAHICTVQNAFARRCDLKCLDLRFKGLLPLSGTSNKAGHAARMQPL